MQHPKIAAFGAAVLALFALTGPAGAMDKLKVGKAVPNAYSFTPLDIGIEYGLFKKHNLEIEVFGMGGSAKLQQALIAKSLDIGIGSGPELNFVAKGAPVIGVAQMAGPPKLLVVLAGKGRGIETVKDLKGKKISVSTAGGLTDWLAHELSRQQGWGPDGIQVVPLGAPTAQAAAMKAGQIDGMLTDLGLAYRLETEGAGKVLLNFGDIVKDFIIHVIYTNNEFRKEHPDQVRRFLAGWFETIAYMKTHKAESVKVSARIMNTPIDVTGRIYDTLMDMFSANGKFDKKGLETLANSFVELNMLPEKPDMSKLYTEEYLPANSGKGS
jgi:ABC-type nitrate/sulfonate/bicarbonate transport system substrate-binding protein